MPRERMTIAMVFIIYWFATQAGATKSLRAYLYRTSVVAVYSVLTWQDYSLYYSEIEWWADCLVAMHFCMVLFFLQPDRLNWRANA
jgi:hypothetical protein